MESTRADSSSLQPREVESSVILPAALGGGGRGPGGRGPWTPEKTLEQMEKFDMMAES
jgi:hypothetical protein